MKKAKYPGWRTMTSAQRHNARQDLIWEKAMSTTLTIKPGTYVTDASDSGRYNRAVYRVIGESFDRTIVRYVGSVVKKRAPRPHTKGDTLQTSRGAECPFAHAIRAYRMAQHCRANATAWETNGHKIPVGLFTVDRIDANGTLHAGCHAIAYEAMTRLAVREVPEEVKACFPVPACI